MLRIPHVICPDRGAKHINVPWATLGSGFTLLFKALAMTLMTAMPGIKQVCIDMSAAFINGVTGNLPEVEITIDKFCAVKLVNDAVDKVRRAESKGRPELKRSRSGWLRNEPSLSAGGRRQPAALTKLHLKTERAYQIRLAFKEIYRQPKQGWGTLFLDR